MHSAETSTLPRGETRQEIEQFLHHESSVHELRMCGGHGEHWFRTMEGMRTVEGDGASQRWRTRQPCLPSGAASRHGASCMLAHICTIRSAWLGVIYGSRQSMSATQHAQFLTRTHTHPFLLHLTNRPTMLTFIHVFSAFMSRLPRRGRPPRYRLRPAACLASWPDLVCAKNFETGSACLKRSFRLREGLDYVADGLFTSHKLPHTWFC
jgi:hypothetical protein